METLLLSFLVCLCSCQVTVKRQAQSNNYVRERSLETDLQLLRDELRHIKDNTKKEIDQLKTQLNLVESKVNQSMSEFDTYSSEKRIKARTTFAAFGIHPTRDSVRVHKNMGDVIIYYHVTLNDGGHYNSTTGFYTCPVNGVYFFSFSVFGGGVYGGPSSSVASARLVKESLYLDLIYFDNDNPGGIDVTLSRSTITDCSVGQRVCVESTVNRNYLWSSDQRNVFSGFVLYLK